MLLTGCFGSLRPRTPPTVDHGHTQHRGLVTASSSDSLSLADTDSTARSAGTTADLMPGSGLAGTTSVTLVTPPRRCKLALTALERAAVEAEMRELADVPLFAGPWTPSSPPHAAVPPLNMRVVHLMRAAAGRKVQQQVACTSLAMKPPHAAAMVK